MRGISKSLFQPFQQMVDLNVKLVQTRNHASKPAYSYGRRPDRSPECRCIASPTSDQKLRAYQQHLSRVAADVQVELARVTEHDVQNTLRTARQLADEVARTSSQETGHSLRKQQEAIQRFTDPFSGNSSSSNAQPQAQGANSGVNVQSGEMVDPRVGRCSAAATPRQVRLWPRASTHNNTGTRRITLGVVLPGVTALTEGWAATAGDGGPPKRKAPRRSLSPGRAAG
jgi:hypothetical protein